MSTSHDPFDPHAAPPQAPSPQRPAGWGPPPPWAPPHQRTSPWVWVSLATSVVALGVVALSFVLPFLFYGVGLGGGWDEEYVDEEPDGQYWVEQSSVTRAVAEPCRRLADAAEDVDLFGGPEAGAASLGELASTMRAVASAIDDADPDEASRAWREDWTLVADRLDEYADAVRGGDAATFSANDDGVDVVERMAWAAPMSCSVPAVVMSLDPGGRSAPALPESYAY